MIFLTFNSTKSKTWYKDEEVKFFEALNLESFLIKENINLNSWRLFSFMIEQTTELDQLYSQFEKIIKNSNKKDLVAFTPTNLSK